MDITITISNTEYQALEYAAYSPQEWVENCVENRARIAIDEIVALYTKRAFDEGVTIPSSREEIVADAFTRGWVQTLATQPQDIIPQ